MVRSSLAHDIRRVSDFMDQDSVYFGLLGFRIYKSPWVIYPSFVSQEECL